MLAVVAFFHCTCSMDEIQSLSRLLINLSDKLVRQPHLSIAKYLLYIG